MSKINFENANNRIIRAEKIFNELKRYLLVNSPYNYVLEVNLHRKQCCTYSKENKYVIAEIKLDVGDLIHQLRVALDNAYWECVSPVIVEKDHGKIQFPIAKKKTGYEDNLIGRLANKVSVNFFERMKRIKAYPDEDGNKILCMIHELDIVDKHKFPNPIADYTTVSTSLLIKQIKDFPSNVNLNNVSFGSNYRDICWNFEYYEINEKFKAIPPTTFLYEKELNVNVGIQIKTQLPLEETLEKMIQEVKNVILILSE